MANNSDTEAGSGFLGSGFLGKDKDGDSKTIINTGSPSKLFRLFTVFMYVSLVSGLGLVLAVYHFFFWDSTMPPVAKVPGHEIY